MGASNRKQTECARYGTPTQPQDCENDGNRGSVPWGLAGNSRNIQIAIPIHQNSE